MPANLAEINGKVAFAGNIENGLWWHKTGTQLQGQKSGEEILEAASLNWRVAKSPLLTPVVGQGTGFVDVPYKVATVRDIDSRVLGVVGPSYQVIQNEELAAFANALIKVHGGVKFESAGALFDGRIVWMLAALPEKAFKVSGDNGEVMPYLLLRTGHDGLTSFMLGPSAVRVVCGNTYNVAIAGLRDRVVIRHTVDAMSYVERAQKALNVNVEYFDGLAQVSEELVKRPMTIKDVIKATEKLIPSTAVEPEKAVKAQKHRDSIIALYQNSANLDGVPESGYRFVQAVGEWADWQRVYRPTKKGDSDSARAAAILDGTARTIKQRAVALVLPAAAKRTATGQFAKVAAAV